MVLEDVTERKRLQDEGRAADELRAALESVRAVCHELNQPLQAVAAYAQLAMSALEEDQPALEELREIPAEVARMGRIVQRLQGIARNQTMAHRGHE